MKQQNDKPADSHHYWTHFVFGLIFGAVIGACVGWSLFDSGSEILVMTVVGSLAVAGSCGRWGDRAWQTILEWFSRSTWW